MRRGPFSGGTCSGMEFESIDNAREVWVLDRGRGTFEIYEWDGGESRWVVAEESQPVDGDRFNESAGTQGVEQIQHPNPAWVPVPVEEGEGD